VARRERLITTSDQVAERGRGYRFTLDAADGSWLPAFAVRFRGKVFAYVNKCAHIGVELDWAEGDFFDGSGLYLVCATHGAAYFPDSGKCAMGPCKGGGLQPLHTTEHGGNIYLIEEEDTTDE